MDTNVFFTSANITGVTVATAAVTLVTKTIYQLWEKAPRKWIAFIVSLVIAYLAVATKTAPPWYEWIFALLNACLLFCSALGANEFTAPKPPPGQGMVDPQVPRFLRSWF